MGKKQGYVWKPVALPESLIANGVDGLVGIEELCDYKIESKQIVTSEPKHKKQNDAAVRVVSRKRRANAIVPCKERKVKKFCSGTWVVSEIEMHEAPDKLKQNQAQNKSDKISKSEQLKTKMEISSDLNWNAKSKISTVNWNEKNSDNFILNGMEAWSSFKLPLVILQALHDLGFQKPTHIQELTLPAAIMGRRDILGAAETGSGKTLAFGIPIIYGILKEKNYASQQRMRKDEQKSRFEETFNMRLKETISKGDKSGQESINFDSPCLSEKKLYALILVPTRELAIQVKNHLVAIAKYTNLKIATLVGGLATQKQERLLKSKPEIVVATPGRLWELIESGNTHLERVNDISFLAIDETDRMLERGHFQELQTLLDRINRDEFKKKKRQNFVFSATLTLVHDPPKYMKQQKFARITPGQKLQQIMSSLGITNPKVVDITLETGISSTLSESRIMCSSTEKDYYLYYIILNHPGRTLVFCNSITCVRRLISIFDILQCKPLPLHANMQQKQRLKNLERFRDNPRGLLLASDVAARGLDIPNVDHVIHYQVPRSTESYIHRSGRTARAQNKGVTVLLLDSQEAPLYIRLCKSLGRAQDLPDFSVEEHIFSAAKARVDVARKIDQLEHTLRHTNFQYGWFKKTAKEMDMLLDEDELPHKPDSDSSTQVQREVKSLKLQLKNLLGQHLALKSVLVKSQKNVDLPLATNKRNKRAKIFPKLIH